MSNELRKNMITSASLSVKTAREYCKIDKYKHMAMAILQDCLDRKGIKSAFREVEDEIIEDIISTWIEIIKLCEKG